MFYIRGDTSKKKKKESAVTLVALHTLFIHRAVYSLEVVSSGKSPVWSMVYTSYFATGSTWQM